MAYKDVYGSMIREVLERRGPAGATTDEIIAAVQGQVYGPRMESVGLRPETGWGIRAAMNRLFRKAEIAKRFEYKRVPVAGGRQQLVRVYRLFLRQYAPEGLDVSMLPPPVPKGQEARSRTVTPEERAQIEVELRAREEKSSLEASRGSES